VTNNLFPFCLRHDLKFDNTILGENIFEKESLHIYD